MTPTAPQPPDRTASVTGPPGAPDLPAALSLYLAHTAGGVPIRALARAEGVHPSTVLRRVRRWEDRRDDPLIDRALDRLARSARTQQTTSKETTMPSTARAANEDGTHPMPEIREALRILRRLAEPGACLALARDMDTAVVVRDTEDGRTLRTAAVDRALAEALAVRDWVQIDGEPGGRILRYRITGAGRAALKRGVPGDGEDTFDRFSEQHRDMTDREVGGQGGAPRRRARYNLAESPLTALARRRDKDGKPFLSPALVAAGERLREDFELARMGPRVTQNWERFLTGGERGAFTGGGAGNCSGPQAARERVSAALTDLGPGLGDVALRCCCFLEGLEAAEQRMGWSARSGKIVLRIALQRLKRHYDERAEGWSPMIG